MTGPAEGHPQVRFGVCVPHDADTAALAVRIAEGDGPEAWAAFEALAARGDEDSLAVLLRAAVSPDRFVRRIAIESIGRHALGAQAADVVHAALGDTTWTPIVTAACGAARALGLAAEWDTVLALVGDSRADVREAALQALTGLPAGRGQLHPTSPSPVRSTGFSRVVPSPQGR